MREKKMNKKVYVDNRQKNGFMEENFAVRNKRRDGVKELDKRKYCSECRYMKKYDYGNIIYYCDHEGRADDMGKLGVDHLPKKTPEWCPLRK